MRLLTLDTGVTTGIAMWTDEAKDDTKLAGTISSWALPRQAAEDFIATQMPHVDHVVSERLVISQATIRKGRQVQEAIEMVGLIRWLCRTWQVSHSEQAPSEAMGFATDEKLKRAGWYVPGPDHQRDARRHALLYLTEHGLIDASTLLR